MPEIRFLLITGWSESGKAILNETLLSTLQCNDVNSFRSRIACYFFTLDSAVFFQALSKYFSAKMAQCELNCPVVALNSTSWRRTWPSYLHFRCFIVLTIQQSSITLLSTSEYIIEVTKYTQFTFFCFELGLKSLVLGHVGAQEEIIGVGRPLDVVEWYHF